MAGESDRDTPKRPHWCLGSDGGYKHGTTNEAQIREWWTQHPEAWIGMWPGPSGLLIIDLDGKDGKQGIEGWVSMPETNGDLGQCAIPTLSRAGFHVWFRRPQGVGISSRRGTLPKDIDVRCDAGGVVLYELPPEEKIQPAPAWLIQRLQSGGRAYDDGNRIIRGNVIDMGAEFQERGLYLDSLGGGKHAVTCPWSEEHSMNSGITETVIFEPSEEGAVWGFKCHHSHCDERTIKDVWRWITLQRSIEAAPDSIRYSQLVQSGALRCRPKPEPAETDDDEPDQEQTTAAGAFVAQSAEEFMKRRFPPKELLIENLLHRRDLVALGARRRNGKTSFLTNMAVALATGAPEFAGFAIPRPRRTLLVMLEDDGGEYQNLLRAVAGANDLGGRLRVLVRDDFEERGITIDAKDPKFQAVIMEHAIQHRADVVVLDNLAHLVAARYGDPEVIHDTMKWAYRLARTANAAVIIAAHPRKNGSGDGVVNLSSGTKIEFFESIMGSSHFINTTGSLWGLERDEVNDRVTFVGGRQRSEGGDRTLYIQRDDDGWFRVLDDAEANRINVINTTKRQQAWDLLPKSFTAVEGERFVNGVMKPSAFYGWLKLCVQARLLKPAGGLAVSSRRYTKAIN
jgi:hypothetical protein